MRRSRAGALHGERGAPRPAPPHVDVHRAPDRARGPGGEAGQRIPRRVERRRGCCVAGHDGHATLRTRVLRRWRQVSGGRPDAPIGPSPRGRPTHRAGDEQEGRAMGRRVAIVGAALSDCGRVDDKSAFELHHQATTRALADAGIAAQRGRRLHVPRHRQPAADRARRVPRDWRRTSTTSTPPGSGGSCWEMFLEHAVAAIAAGPDRDRPAVLRLDVAGRSEAPHPHRQPLLRKQGPHPVRRPVRPHPDREARDVGAPAHVRVRHDHRAARRDRRLGPLQRRVQPRSPTTATPSPSRTSSRRG